MSFLFIGTAGFPIAADPSAIAISFDNAAVLYASAMNISELYSSELFSTNVSVLYLNNVAFAINPFADVHPDC